MAARALWEGVDRRIDAATVSGLLVHKLGPVGAHRLRSLGQPVPPALLYEERAASVNMMTGIPLVRRIRESCEGPLLLVKGPELARLYPARARRFGDIDLLTPDAGGIQRQLLDAGFVYSPHPDDIEIEGHHHLRPLVWPTISLRIEIHSRPNWPVQGRCPPLSELIARSLPTSLGVEGVSTPSALHHTLLVASHAWRSAPLETLRDLIDVAALAAQVDRAELDWTARAWRIERLWRTTRDAIDGLFFGGRRTIPLRTWARHLEPVRERSVFENHMDRWGSAHWELPPAPAVQHTLGVLRDEFRPAPGETWGEKARRVGVAVRHARLPAATRRRGLDRSTSLRQPSEGSPD